MSFNKKQMLRLEHLFKVLDPSTSRLTGGVYPGLVPGLRMTLRGRPFGKLRDLPKSHLISSRVYGTLASCTLRIFRSRACP